MLFQFSDKRIGISKVSAGRALVAFYPNLKQFAIWFEYRYRLADFVFI